jgi:hypothetical protein
MEPAKRFGTAFSFLVDAGTEPRTRTGSCSTDSTHLYSFTFAPHTSQ